MASVVFIFIRFQGLMSLTGNLVFGWISTFPIIAVYQVLLRSRAKVFLRYERNVGICHDPIFNTR
jgi:hypothetical protein